jgi:hypothetical protein
MVSSCRSIAGDLLFGFEAQTEMPINLQDLQSR